MPWAELIPLIMQIIRDCQQDDQTDDEIFQTIRGGGFMVRYSLRQIARDKGLPIRQRNQWINETLDDLANAEDVEIHQLIREARQSA